MEFFGAALDQMTAYAGLLAGAAVERGLIGPREVPRLWERHLLNCAVIAKLIPEGVAVDDIGSGAGLPGIVLALCRPDLRITLVEPLQRRSVFLSEVSAELGLLNVDVVRQRAEDRKGAGTDVVTARAVAPMDRLVGWCLPVLRPGGVLLALKGASAADELVEHADAIRRAGGRDCEVLIVGAGVVDPPTTVVRVVRNPAAQDRPVRNRKKGGRP